VCPAYVRHNLELGGSSGDDAWGYEWEMLLKELGEEEEEEGSDVAFKFVWGV
jgi:hypothetical protein